MLLESTVKSKAKDFQTHARECDNLLHHYTQQFRDREVYWLCREYSRAREGLVCLIIDSYDKSKLSLPRWPFNRVPKKCIYEETRRLLAVFVWFYAFHTFLFATKEVAVSFWVWPKHVWAWGTYLTLTAVICHGWGCFMFLSSEGLAEGSNWNWECAPWFFLMCFTKISLDVGGKIKTNKPKNTKNKA